MASIGGATTDFTPSGTMRTRVSAGDQLGALGAGDGYDPYDFVKRLRADKERARREGLEYDDRRAQRADFQQNALTAAPEQDNTQEAMPLRDMMQAKLVFDQMTPFNTAGGTNTEFRNVPVAAAATGMNLPESGFTQYARIAGAGGQADLKGAGEGREADARARGLI